jgi:hypothetical protein
MQEEFKVAVGTWNLGDAPPDYDQALDGWMPRGGDIYCIALQVRREHVIVIYVF